MGTLPNSPAFTDLSAHTSQAEAALALLGPSSAMAELWTQVRHLAPYARTILLTGPADSGQTAVVRLLLELSHTPSRPLLELPPAEAEEELAGGIFPAHGGECLLYLPEVERLSAKAQEGLARWLRIRRSRGLTVVLGTSTDLSVQVGLGRFSAGLLDLMRAARITLPPLRKRKEDLPMLLSQMLTLASAPFGYPVPRISSAFLRAAMDHNWPGNLRELHRVVDELARRAPELQELTPEHLLEAIGAITAPATTASQVRMVALETIVHEHIHAVLRACRGNKLRAAETLGISRSTLYRMLDTDAGQGGLKLAS